MPLQLQHADLENWHDFTIESRREIIALLRNIGDKNQLINVLVRGQSEVCMTTILEVDSDHNAVILDCAASPEQQLRILRADSLSYETSLDKIRIMFASGRAVQCSYGGRPALRIALPPTLIRLQRREYFRLDTPLSNPVRVFIPLLAEAGGGNNGFPLADISCGGVTVVDNKLVLGDTIGKIYRNCRLDLPIGPVAAHLQIRNVIDQTLLNNRVSRRLGCQFTDLSREALGQVQRYITRLERERNARNGRLG